jgi:hypothetical protein
MDVRAIHSAS